MHRLTAKGTEHKLSTATQGACDQRVGDLTGNSLAAVANIYSCVQLVL